MLDEDIYSVPSILNDGRVREEGATLYRKSMHRPTLNCPSLSFMYETRNMSTGTRAQVNSDTAMPRTEATVEDALLS